MKKILFALVITLALPVLCHGHVIEELWNKYAGYAQPPVMSVNLETPGRILGAPQGEGDAGFKAPWKFRHSTYELHFENPSQLARSIYGLALFTRDIAPDLPREKFYSGVLGFHYTVKQICDWLNDAQKNKISLTPEENSFVGMLLEDQVIGLEKGIFAPLKNIKHVLGASTGKKRLFADNLRHERLHVFWDENANFRKGEEDAWKALNEADRTAAREKLKNYAQNNEAQLIEEWAIYRAEQNKMPLN